MTNRDPARDQLLAVIDGGQAYMSFEEAVGEFPSSQYNTKPVNVAYSFWHILEHMRRVNRDILDYIREPDYRSGTWPNDYWPRPDETADDAAWNQTLRQIREDMATLRTFVADPTNDLHVPVPNAGDQPTHTLLREVLLVVEHNAYHTGEFAVLRQVAGTWPADHA